MEFNRNNRKSSIITTPHLLSQRSHPTKMGERTNPKCLRLLIDMGFVLLRNQISVIMSNVMNHPR